MGIQPHFCCKSVDSAAETSVRTLTIFDTTKLVNVLVTSTSAKDRALKF